MESGILIVLTGRTASGKDTIQALLLSKYPNLARIVTTTSRKIREGEKDGLDYHFITEDEFKKKISGEDFLEYVEYGGNLYGTTKAELEKALNKDTIWRIDPSRAGEIRHFINNAYPPQIAQNLLKRLIVIFITCSEDVILQRLKQRNLSKDEIEKRRRDDKEIWEKFKDKYDYVVENEPEKLDQTVEKVLEIIKKHRFTG